MKTDNVTERVENIMGRGKGGTILVHIGTNNADKEGTTACFTFCIGNIYDCVYGFK